MTKKNDDVVDHLMREAMARFLTVTRLELTRRGEFKERTDHSLLGLLVVNGWPSVIFSCFDDVDLISATRTVKTGRSMLGAQE